MLKGRAAGRRQGRLGEMGFVAIMREKQREDRYMIYGQMRPTAVRKKVGVGAQPECQRPR